MKNEQKNVNDINYFLILLLLLLFVDRTASTPFQAVALPFPLFGHMEKL